MSKRIFVWPDGTWLCPEEEPGELDYIMANKSDDYGTNYVDEALDYEEIDSLVQDLIKGGYYGPVG